MKSASLSERISTDFAFHRALVTLGGNTRALDAWEWLMRELRLALSIVDGIRRGDIDAAVHGINDVISPVRAALSARWAELHKEWE